MDEIKESSPEAAALIADTPPSESQAASLGREEGTRLQSPKKKPRLEPQAILIETDLDWDAKPAVPASPLQAEDNAGGTAAWIREKSVQPSIHEADPIGSSPEEERVRTSAFKQPQASTAREASLPPACDSAVTSASPPDDYLEHAKDSRQTVLQTSKSLLRDSRRDEAYQESHGLSSAAMEDYSPSRHGGESPPRVQAGMQGDLIHQVSLFYGLAQNCTGISV